MSLPLTLLRSRMLRFGLACWPKEHFRSDCFSSESSTALLWSPEGSKEEFVWSIDGLYLRSWRTKPLLLILKSSSLELLLLWLFLSLDFLTGFFWLKAPERPILSKLRSLNFTFWEGGGCPTLKCCPIWILMELSSSWEVKSEFSFINPDGLEELLRLWNLKALLACLNPFSIIFLCLSSSVSCLYRRGGVPLPGLSSPLLVPRLLLLLYLLSNSSKPWMMSLSIYLLIALTPFSSDPFLVLGLCAAIIDKELSFS